MKKEQRACVFRKWLRMVFIPFLGFGIVLGRRSIFGARDLPEFLLFALPQHGQDSPRKQAHIERGWAKGE